MKDSVVAAVASRVTIVRFVSCPAIRYCTAVTALHSLPHSQWTLLDRHGRNRLQGRSGNGIIPMDRHPPMVFSGTVPRGETHPIPTTADQSYKDGGTVGKALGPVEAEIGVLGFELDTEVAKSIAWSNNTNNTRQDGSSSSFVVTYLSTDSDVSRHRCWPVF